MGQSATAPSSPVVAVALRLVKMEKGGQGDHALPLESLEDHGHASPLEVPVEAVARCWALEEESLGAVVDSPLSSSVPHPAHHRDVHHPPDPLATIVPVRYDKCHQTTSCYNMLTYLTCILSTSKSHG